MPGLKREEIVFLNRLRRDYAQDELPHGERIRYDFARAILIVTHLNDEIEKLIRLKA